MGRLRHVVVLVGVVLGLASCGGGGGGSATPTPTTPTPTVTSVIVTAPSSTAKPGDSSQLTATATLSNGTAQTVTNQATWQSTNTAVVTVSSTGFVTAASPGDADIRATYQSVTGTAHVTVTAPAPPAPPPTTFSICGITKEDTGSTPVSSATVAVKDTTLSTTSSAVGAFCVTLPTSGRFTLRATKSGYDLGETTVTVTGNATADVVMHKQSSPAPTPAPGPGPTPGPTPTPGPNGPTCTAASIPANASCINNGTPPVTAVCNDGVFSCSANRSGTCSTHGGVLCWVCPGTLCNGLLGVDQVFSPATGGFSPALRGR